MGPGSGPRANFWARARSWGPSVQLEGLCFFFIVKLSKKNFNPIPFEELHNAKNMFVAFDDVDCRSRTRVVRWPWA